MAIKFFYRISLLCFLLATCVCIARAQNNAPDIPDTLLFKIQKAQAIIAEVNAQNKKGYGISRNRDVLVDVKTNTDPINTDLKTQGKATDSKTLSEYSYILNESQNQLNALRNNLAASSNELQKNINEVVKLSSDSLLILSEGDTSAKKLYAAQLNALRLQLQDAGTQASAKLQEINQLLATASGLYTTVTELQNILDDELESRQQHVLQKEVPFLWAAPLFVNVNHVKELVRSTYVGQNKILKYFLASTWDNRLLLMLLAATFFIWIFRNFKKEKELQLNQHANALQFQVIRPVPVIATLLFILNLTPLFEINSPPVYIELDQFLLMLVLTFYLWIRLSKAEFRLWTIYAISFILLLLTNAIVNVALVSRLWLIALNVSFIYFGLLIKRKLAHAEMSDNFIKPVNIFFIGLQIASVVLNIFGRISLSKSLGITAVIALTQVIGLAAFIHAVVEAMELQINVSSFAGGLYSRVNVATVRRSLKKILSWLAVIIWCIVLFINLGASDNVFNFLIAILSRPHTLGSITFTIGNVFFFIIIIYLSGVLQKNIGLLFGENHLAAANNEIVQKSSKLALIRLIVIIAGFLFAIAASGISLTKLTVVLGALSVGIGLGMQNIVNNFVSGIILIFEKPFRIGDYVEIGDKKGKIEDIGIRSSKMLTLQGSQVIIPNSDFLSNRLTNWTANNLHMKTELVFKVHADTNIEDVTKLIQQNISKLNGVLNNSKPDIFIDAIGADNIQLRVLFWITNLYSEAVLKTNMYQQLLNEFKAKGIKVMG